MSSRTRPADPVEIESASKSSNTRQRILDATAVVLSRKGYAGTRLSDVAVAAEIQAPAIYYYFDSREDLIQEVMWVGIARMREHLVQSLEDLPPQAGALDRILAAVEAHLRYELSISEYATATIRNAGQLPDHIRARQMEEQAKYALVWRELFEQAKNANELRSDMDAELARLFVIGALNWAAEWWTSKTCSMDKVVQAARAFVEAGITNPQKARGEAT